MRDKIAFPVAIALCLSLPTGCTGLGSQNDEMGRLDISLPESVADLVAVSDLILRGTVIEIGEGGSMVAGPQAGEVLPNQSGSVPTMLPLPSYDIPLTFSTVRVDELLYSDPSIDVAAGSLITLTTPIELATYSTPTPADPRAKSDVGYLLRMRPPLEEVGDERLFLLTRESAPALAGTFGTVFGAYSVLDLGGSEVRLASSPPIVIDISDSTAVPDFLAELETAIRTR